MDQRSLFGLSDHLERLSKDGDPLEVLEATVPCSVAMVARKMRHLGQTRSSCELSGGCSSGVTGPE